MVERSKVFILTSSLSCIALCVNTVKNSSKAVPVSASNMLSLFLNGLYTAPVVPPALAVIVRTCVCINPLSKNACFAARKIFARVFSSSMLANNHVLHTLIPVYMLLINTNILTAMLLKKVYRVKKYCLYAFDGPVVSIPFWVKRIGQKLAIRF